MGLLVRKFAILLLILMSFAGPTTAYADRAGGGDGREAPDPGGESGGRSGGVAFAGYRTSIKISTSAQPGGDTSSGPRYICELVGVNSLPGYSGLPGFSRDPADGLIEGVVYGIQCHLASAPDGDFVFGTPDLIVWDPADPTDGRIVTAPDVQRAVEQARRLDLPGPEITTSPPPEDLVVGFETWFANVGAADGDNPELPSAEPIKATAGAFWAIATTQASSISFDMGDGEPGSVFECTTAQAAFDPERPVETQRPDCARYSYQFSSNNEASPGGTYLVATTVTYDIFIETQSQPPTYFETLTSEATELDVTVTARQSVIR